MAHQKVAARVPSLAGPRFSTHASRRLRAGLSCSAAPRMADGGCSFHFLGHFLVLSKI